MSSGAEANVDATRGAIGVGEQALKVLGGHAEGTLSTSDWTGYPASMARPTGPVRQLLPEEYEAARKAADLANGQIRDANGLRGSGYDIHEVQPVVFGGSPTDWAKVLLPASKHTGRAGVHPEFWDPLLRWVPR